MRAGGGPEVRHLGALPRPALAGRRQQHGPGAGRARADRRARRRAGADRLQRAPQTAPGRRAGLVGAGINGESLHPTLDYWWRQRGFRGDVNHLPILMVDGFFDVESRGAFQAYQALRGDGAHLGHRRARRRAGRHRRRRRRVARVARPLRPRGRQRRRPAPAGAALDVGRLPRERPGRELRPLRRRRLAGARHRLGPARARPGEERHRATRSTTAR